MSVLLDVRHSYIHIHIFQRNLSVLSWVIFQLKGVNFLFLFSIFYRPLATVHVVSPEVILIVLFCVCF